MHRQRRDSCIAYLDDADVSTDLFATGVVLYELLTDGAHPYAGRIPMLDEQVIDPRMVRHDISGELASFLLQACAPEREHRFQTANSMKEALLVASTE